jgi:hypothetical protein
MLTGVIMSASIFLRSILTGTFMILFVDFGSKKKASAEVEAFYIVMHNGA